MGVRASQKIKKTPELRALNERIDYVLSCAIRLDLFNPFLDGNWDAHVWAYLRFGDEQRKDWFPGPKPGNLERLLESVGSKEEAQLHLEQVRKVCIKANLTEK